MPGPVSYTAILDASVLVPRFLSNFLLWLAAIKCGANAIVTSNLKDFPVAVLARFEIQPINQDDFVLDQIGLTGISAHLVAIAVVRHKKSFTRSRKNWRQYFEAMSLKGVGLRKTHAELTSPRFKAIIADVLKSGGWIPE